MCKSSWHCIERFLLEEAISRLSDPATQVLSEPLLPPGLALQHKPISATKLETQYVLSGTRDKLVFCIN